MCNANLSPVITYKYKFAYLQQHMGFEGNIIATQLYYVEM